MSKGIAGFVRINELMDILSVSRSTVFRMERDGILPHKVQISKRTVGFRTTDIEKFIKTRIRDDHQVGIFKKFSFKLSR